MDAAGSTLAANRIRRFLESEPVVWVSTVRPDGTPHLVPIWFWWDGEALLVFSKPDAQKVRNLRANPSVMLALGDAEPERRRSRSTSGAGKTTASRCRDVDRGHSRASSSRIACCRLDLAGRARPSSAGFAD